VKFLLEEHCVRPYLEARHRILASRFFAHWVERVRVHGEFHFKRQEGHGDKLFGWHEYAYYTRVNGDGELKSVLAYYDTLVFKVNCVALTNKLGLRLLIRAFGFGVEIWIVFPYTNIRFGVTGFLDERTVLVQANVFTMRDYICIDFPINEIF